MSNSAVEILTSQRYFNINLGLERISALLNLYGNPQDKLKCIHVAGTNGKGSVCAVLNTILISNGFNVGLFTSPHIFDYNERIKINNKDISDEDFDALVLEVSNVAKSHDINITEFEILTAVAFIYFEKKCVDYVVLETGLGGRFDATNVIKKNECAIITHLDLEHTDRLGNTIEKIAFEKAGIIKPFCPVIIGEEQDVIQNVAEEKNSELFFAPLTNKVCSLKGEHQKFNLALALKACEVLGITVRDECLLNVKNPCRFEYLPDYNIIVDVAHNPNGIKALRENLDMYYKNQSFNFIFGCLSTKDYKKMLKYLLKEDDKLYVYEFLHSKSCKYEDLQKVTVVKLYHFEEYKKEKKITVICGSFYMLKELFNDIGLKYN